MGMAEWMGFEFPGWILVAIAIGLVLVVSRKISSASGLLGSRVQAPGIRARPKSKQGKEKLAVASEAAKNIAKSLGVTVRLGPRQVPVPVTVCVNDVLLARSPAGEWIPIESALRVVALLSEVASVFLVAWVGSDEEERQIKKIALSAGLTAHINGPSVGNATSKVPSITAGIPQHKLVFCSSHIGQVAIVRQLTPSLHIGGSIALLGEISRFVPSLLRIDPDAVELPPELTPSPPASSAEVPSSGQAAAAGSYSLGWREFKSLAAAAGLPPYAHTAEPLADEVEAEYESSRTRTVVSSFESSTEGVVVTTASTTVETVVTVKTVETVETLKTAESLQEAATSALKRKTGAGMPS